MTHFILCLNSLFYSQVFAQLSTEVDTNQDNIAALSDRVAILEQTSVGPESCLDVAALYAHLPQTRSQIFTIYPLGMNRL